MTPPIRTFAQVQAGALAEDAERAKVRAQRTPKKWTIRKLISTALEENAGTILRGGS